MTWLMIVTADLDLLEALLTVAEREEATATVTADPTVAAAAWGEASLVIVDLRLMVAVMRQPPPGELIIIGRDDAGRPDAVIESVRSASAEVLLLPRDSGLLAARIRQAAQRSSAMPEASR